ncbi:MAG: hypothetical protein AB202_02295 [Parcubacteria bacterium C7867-007]|nr:MAG: hypothetical protein AB202_02295 [Parcubacteria bacterium C7867-007]
MKIVTAHDPMQPGYCYELTAPEGEGFDSEFKPDLTPKDMFERGVFGGNYFEGHLDEFPKDWLKNAKISTVHDKSLNYFGIDASQPYEVWKAKGWIYKDDPRGWFQWYCRYYRGRRIPEEDARQIKRWKQMVRHVAQVRYGCRKGDFTCRTRQRQALLHWAYDSAAL